ncbi:MAG TPA: hypothetical protein VI758_05075 [Bacteroidota bacterium]
MKTLHRTLSCTLVIIAAVTSVSQSQQISLTGGNVTLSIATGTAGGQLINVVNTSVSLQYQKQGVLSKITVSTSCPGQRYNLSVLATSVTKGVAAPQVSLIDGSPAIDFITSIPKTGAPNGNATLQYTASATFSQGNSSELGDDVHTITYTILAQ